MISTAVASPVVGVFQALLVIALYGGRVEYPHVSVLQSDLLVFGFPALVGFATHLFLCVRLGVPVTSEVTWLRAFVWSFVWTALAQALALLFAFDRWGT